MERFVIVKKSHMPDNLKKKKNNGTILQGLQESLIHLLWKDLVFLNTFHDL